MASEATKSLDDVFDSLQLEKTAVKTKFVCAGIHFWLPPGSGTLRKKIPASNFLLVASRDLAGMMSGKYEDAIRYLLNGVYCEHDGEAYDMSGDGFYQFADMLPEDQQFELLSNLPQAVASVIVGKPTIERIIRERMNSGQSTNSPESQNTTNPDQSLPASVKKSKKPARKSPKLQK